MEHEHENQLTKLSDRIGELEYKMTEVHQTIGNVTLWSGLGVPIPTPASEAPSNQTSRVKLRARAWRPPSCS